MISEYFISSKWMLYQRIAEGTPIERFESLFQKSTFTFELTEIYILCSQV